LEADSCYLPRQLISRGYSLQSKPEYLVTVLCCGHAKTVFIMVVASCAL
jgi:hypothetical protein